MNLDSVKFGPFRGYQGSVEAVVSPPDFLVTGSADVQIDPASQLWQRRKGCSIVGDTVDGSTFKEVTGLLETGMRFGARPRKLFPFTSPSISSGKSTVACLYGYDTNSASFPTVDTGWFGTLYLRASATATDPQTPSGANYNLMSEFANHYPTNTGTFVPSSTGLMVCPPLWYESGEGGYHRGANRFTRQFLTAGSRSCVVAGKRVITPSLRATPVIWDGTLNATSGTGTTNTVRYFPLGPFSPLPTVTIAAGAVSTGNDAVWDDGDTFYYSVINRDEFGAFSQATLPRAVNANLANGLYLKVVGTIGGTAKYRSVVWSNIPVGPPGTVERVLCRGPKQSRTAATDVITVDPLDLRPIGILTNNTQTSFTDTQGSDVGLDENPDVVRFDTICPRRARYMWTGDQRVQIGYTLPSQHAIILAPTGTTASGDLSDEAEDSVNVQGTTGYVYRITLTGLDLYQYTSSTTLGTVVTIDWATYPTLQDVVDKINATTVGASACKEWRAQVSPGADPSAASTTLCPSTWNITNCTTGNVASSTLTCTGGSTFANIPLGYFLTGTGVTTGTYVVSKASATSMTVSQNVTVPNGTALNFSAYTGDGTGASNYWSASIVGLMRAFCPAYPGFIYFKRSALPGYDKPDKQQVFFTIGSPGAAAAGSSLAPNTWGRDDRRLPSISNPGILLGGVDIEGAAIVAYSGGICLFQNTRGANTGEDFDYKLFTINGNRGPVSWSALTAGNGWAAYTTKEGVYATDKNRREFSIGGAIYSSARKMGDIASEIDASLLATDSDNDNSHLYMSVARNRLVLSYLNVASTPLILFYDFSPGLDASGVEELANPDTKQPYGWSAPCNFNASISGAGLSLVGAVPSSAGMAVYATGEGNNGTNDGRIDQIETGNTDNGLPQFSGSAYMPVFLGPDFSYISPQRMEVLHQRPNGTNLTMLNLSRTQDFGNPTSYNLSNTGSNPYANDLVQLKSNPDRSRTPMVQLAWVDQETTQGNGFWSVALQYQRLPA